MTTTTETTSTTSPTFSSFSAGTRWTSAWQGTFAAVMGIALTGLVALAFGSITERTPAVTAQDCGALATSNSDRC